MVQLQRTVEEMQVSLSEREAEIIRLNLCLGDEKKRNITPKNMDMPLQNNTPQSRSISRSSSRATVNTNQPVVHLHQMSMSSNETNHQIVPRNMVMDSPYFQKTLSSKVQETQTEAKSQQAETQTQIIGNELVAKLQRYEAQIRAESTANEELAEQLTIVQKEVQGLRQERDQLKSSNKSLMEENLKIQNEKKGLETDFLSYKEHSQAEASKLKQQSVDSQHSQKRLEGQLKQVNKETLLYTSRIDELNRELEHFKELSQIPPACDTCTDYIKKMKGLEFRVSDLVKEKELKQQHIGELQHLLDRKDSELKSALAELKSAHAELKAQNLLRMSTSSQNTNLNQDQQVNEVLRREVDRQRKKNEVSEAVIAQLKKELEKYAYEVIRMQEMQNREQQSRKKSAQQVVCGNSFGAISEITNSKKCGLMFYKYKKQVMRMMMWSTTGGDSNYIVYSYSFRSKWNCGRVLTGQEKYY